MCDTNFDPDLKIHMSLDEIIHLSKPSLTQNNIHRIKRKRNRRRKNLSTTDHSIPLLSSLGGGYIYVSKNSPLLSAAKKREIATAVSNRVLNQKLIKKNKEIILASYQLVKTTAGVERVLVPVEDHILNTQKKSLNGVTKIKSDNNNSKLKEVTHKPPPLIEKPTYKYTNGDDAEDQKCMKMEVDECNDDDDILVLDVVSKKEKLASTVIDVESGSQMSVPQSLGTQSLNDRFTRLCGSFQF